MKKAVSLVVLLILIVSGMGYGLPPPPPATAGSAPAAAGATSTAVPKEGFVEIMQGQRVPSGMLDLYFSDSRSERGVSENCKSDWFKCTQSDVDKFTTSDWAMTYDSTTDIWNVPNTLDVMKVSDNGLYWVNDKGNIISWDTEAKKSSVVGVLPPGSTFVNIKDVQENVLHFNDGTVMVRNANPIPETLYEKYKQLIDPAKVTVTSIGLIDGGLIVYETKDGVTATTITLKKDVPPQTTWTIAGQEYCQKGCKNEGWTKNNNEFTNTDKRTIIVTVEGMALTITEKNKDKTTTTTISGSGAAQQRAVEQQEKGKVTAFTLYDAQNNVIGQQIKTEKGNLEDFMYIRDGRVIGMCYSSECNKGDKNSDRNIWLTEIDGQFKACQGKSESCYSADGKPITVSFKSQSEVCATPNNPSCSAIQASQQYYYFGNGFSGFFGALADVLSGKTPSTSVAGKIILGKKEAQKTIGEILNFRPGWESLSTWWAPDVTQSWQKFARENFDQLLAAEYVTSEWVCNYDEVNKVKRPGESATFVEVAPGIIQFVGSITAEKSIQHQPVLCYQNPDQEAEEQFICNQGQVCVEDLCYQDTDEDGEPDHDAPVEGYFYKISWAVQAPQDESFTPKIDENGYALRFNVKIFGERELWLYTMQGIGNDQTLRLENGASDKDAIVVYSPHNYNKVCILFSAGAKDKSGDVVNEICADIVESAAGQIEWEQSGRAGSSGSSTGSVRVEDAVRAQI